MARENPVEIKGVECVECGTRVLAHPSHPVLRGWDFGVDADAAEPDPDGFVRGTCPKCLAR